MLTVKFLAWWATVEPARRWLLIGLTLLFFSQFLLYHHNGNYGIAMADGAGGLSTGIYLDPPATGWDEHPLARLVLPALFVVYVSLLRFKPFWVRWGYGVSVFLMFLFGIITGESGATLDVWGTRLGLAAIAMAGYAAYLDFQARKRMV